ncbi:hypothetical protein ACOME3_000587 [Neoechinorhynchus agilis]
MFMKHGRYPSLFDLPPIRTIYVNSTNTNFILRTDNRVKKRIEELLSAGYSSRLIWLTFGGDYPNFDRAFTIIKYDSFLKRYKSFSPEVETNRKGELVIQKVTYEIAKKFYAVGVEADGIIGVIKSYVIQIVEDVAGSICDGRPGLYVKAKRPVKTEVECKFHVFSVYPPLNPGYEPQIRPEIVMELNVGSGDNLISNVVTSTVDTRFQMSVKHNMTIGMKNDGQLIRCRAHFVSKHPYGRDIAGCGFLFKSSLLGKVRIFIIST